MKFLTSARVPVRCSPTKKNALALLLTVDVLMSMSWFIIIVVWLK